jgi:hypothetical protein
MAASLRDLVEVELEQPRQRERSADTEAEAEAKAWTDARATRMPARPPVVSDKVRHQLDLRVVGVQVERIAQLADPALDSLSLRLPASPRNAWSPDRKAVAC